MISHSKNDIVELRKSQSTTVFNKKDTLQSITVNPTELCNRTCSFCPRSNPTVYPNRNLHIDEKTVINLANSIKQYGFKNRLGWSGNGEPLLTKDFLKFVKIVSDLNPELKIHEINTNGDKLSEEMIESIYSAGINHIIVSVYDGIEMFSEYERLFSKYPTHAFTLRNTFSGNLTGFTNRSGLVKVNTFDISRYSGNRCYLPFYKLFVDWNGDILICCEDWSRISKSRLNINSQSLNDIWFSEEMMGYRDKLRLGKRKDLELCKSCNIHGEKVGEDLVGFFYEK